MDIVDSHLVGGDDYVIEMCLCREIMHVNVVVPAAITILSEAPHISIGEYVNKCK